MREKEWENERERKKGAKSGRAASRWRHDDRRRLLAGFVAIIQLVKVSGRVTAHKTNMIAAANCCEPRGSNKGEGGRRAKGLVLSGTDEVITGWWFYWHLHLPLKKSFIALFSSVFFFFISCFNFNELHDLMLLKLCDLIITKMIFRNWWNIWALREITFKSYFRLTDWMKCIIKILFFVYFLWKCIALLDKSLSYRGMRRYISLFKIFYDTFVHRTLVIHVKSMIFLP